jgi:hypothetical protein
MSSVMIPQMAAQGTGVPVHHLRHHGFDGRSFDPEDRSGKIQRFLQVPDPFVGVGRQYLRRVPDCDPPDRDKRTRLFSPMVMSPQMVAFGAI